MMEARKQPRANLALRPEYFSPSEKEFVDGKTHDISTGGMFIEAERMIPSGTLIKIRCEPGAGELIEGVAKVVWNRPRTADTGPAGIGVKFIKLKGDSERVLQRLVEGGIGAAPSEPAAETAEGTDGRPAEPAAATPVAAAPIATEATPEAAPAAPAETKTPSARPSAAELSARLEKARASIPSPAPTGPTSADEPAARSQSVGARAPEPAQRQPEAARESEVVVPRQTTPIYLIIGGLLTAIAAIAAWLLSR